MTNGQLLFYGGVALLALPVLLAIIFIIKKPKYIPELASCDGVGHGGTQQLCNCYSINCLTVCWESVKQSAPETVVLTADQRTVA